MLSLSMLEAQILPAAFSKSGLRFLKCESDSNSSGTDQFASSVIFMTAIVVKNSVEIKIPILVKLEDHNEKLRLLINSSDQFYNEALMYNELIPFLDKNNIVENIFPKCYYSSPCRDNPNNVIVIENLKPLGYRLAPEKGFLDFDHLALALKQIGRFHALSYAAKSESSREFISLIGKLKETTWFEGNTYVPTLVKACFHRAIDPLVSSGRSTAVLLRLLSKIDDSVVKFVKKLVTPEETVAVLCHGDFCRNNMLFKYEQGIPMEVRFFDVAGARYSSSAVDITFFLMMNSSRQMRETHLDDLLRVYHQALSTTIQGLQVPSLHRIREEIRTKLIYGFVHCSYFLPQMLFDHEFSQSGADWVTKIPLEQVAYEHTLVGGEEGTRLLTGMVEELLDYGCISSDSPFLQ